MYWERGLINGYLTNQMLFSLGEIIAVMIKKHPKTIKPDFGCFLFQDSRFDNFLKAVKSKSLQKIFIFSGHQFPRRCVQGCQFLVQ